MKTTWFSVRAGLIALVVVTGLFAAFNTGDVVGVVTDPAGALVPNAKVTITSKETGETRTVNTDAEGRFALNQLKIGLYEIRAEAPGFRVAATEVTVRSGETHNVSFKLEVGQVTEVVTVEDAVTPLDTSNAQIQISVESKQVMEIPVGRNPNIFATISPGVIPVSQNNPFLGSGSYNTNGGRGRGNNVTVDNITATDISVTGTGGPLGPLNFAQIKEVKLITNNFSAEFGRNANSQLQYITKSGTNEFHGEGYEFLQNNALNARDFFDRTGKAAITRFNQFGYVIGGPILRNKTHFFQSYEGTQLRGAGAARIAFVPTTAMLAQVTDPTSKALLDQYKLPAATQGNQVQQAAGNSTKAFQFSLRVDHQLSQRDTLTARYGHYQSTAASSGLTFIGSNLANFGATSVNGPRNISFSETHLFGTSVVNEFRAGFGRSSPNFPINTTVPLGPRVVFLNGEVHSFGVWEGLPQGRVQNTYQYSDTVSWSRGAHNLKFGADVYRYQANSMFDAFQRPYFQFANWADFAAGRPTFYQQRVGGSIRGNRIWNHFYFFQDDWKVARNLTVNLGVRTEVARGVNEVNGLISNLDLGCRDSHGAAGTGPLGCFTIGKPSNNTNTNWGPRVGFAWNPRGDAKTVIRGGYGVTYDFIFLNPITNQRFLPPFIITGSVSGTGSFTGNNTFARIVAGSSDVQSQTRASVGRINPNVTNYGAISPAIDQNLSNPQVQQWNFGVQRELPYSLVLKASYVGTKGNYLQRSRPINLINDPRAAAATSLADETARLAGFQAANAALNAGALGRSNRIDPRFNDITRVDSSSNSNYHAFEFLAHRAFRQGYYFQVAYTVSKSIDDVSDALGVLVNDTAGQQNPSNNRDNRAVSQFDVPQRLVIAHVWEPTWGRNVSNGVLRRLFDGWGFAGISSFQGGFPATFESGSRRGITPLSLSGGANVNRPNVAGPFTFQPIPSGREGAPSTLNTDPISRISTYAQSLGLSQPLLGNYGTIGRNTVRLNGYTNFDWNVYKNTKVTERISVQVRAEFYNTFNNTTFAGVQLIISSPQFGQYSRTEYNQRWMQVGARVIF
jgi:hypothetical protein